MTSDCIQQDGRCLSKSIYELILQLNNDNDNDDKKNNNDNDDMNYDITKQKALKAIKCKTESCVLNYIKENKLLKQQQIIDELKKLLPYGPKFNTQLLSNHNIDDICRIMEIKNEQYKHIGVMMIDIWMIETQQFWDYNMIVQFIKTHNVKYYSIIFNTDPHNREGQHWFAMFIEKNNNNLQIEIFDSQRPKYLIEKSIIKLGKQIIKHFDTDSSLKIVSHGKHQKGGTECGRLGNECSELFSKQVVPDQQMIDLRQDIFREYLIYDVDIRSFKQ